MKIQDPICMILGTITSKINATPKGVRLSENLQLTTALCNEIWPQ